MTSQFYFFGAAYILFISTVAAAASSNEKPAATLSDSLPSESAVMNHLNGMLSWFRDGQSADRWIVQPSDEYFWDNQDSLAKEVEKDAFQYAHAAAVLLEADKISKKGNQAGSKRATHLATLSADSEARLSDLRKRDSELRSNIAVSNSTDNSLLLDQQKVVEAQISFENAVAESLQRSASLLESNANDAGAAGFDAEISALQRASPTVFETPVTESTTNTKNPPKSKVAAPPTSSSFQSEEQNEGLLSRATLLFSLLTYRHAMDRYESKSDELEASINGIASPVGVELGKVYRDGIADSLDTAITGNPDELRSRREEIRTRTTQLKELSAVLIPLRDEAGALARFRANLVQWRQSVIRQSDVILRTLIVRAVGLGIALGLLIGVSELWRRATFRYVRDLRRRRQFLLIRRFAISALICVVIIVGFVSDLSSVATFAGFITAGIAVALQTIILSIAAYFFLIGRYGVKVGDRVTVSGVTGDVVDIGLVRVFLMELAGTGIDLHPTGRVVVLANSALFSSTPLYKQLPGTNYAWHELYGSVSSEGDPAKIAETLLKVVGLVYGEYKSSIEQQHGELERIVDFQTAVPAPSSHIRLADSGLEVIVRYPAEIRRASEIDDAVARAVLASIQGNEELKKSLVSLPHIRSAVKS